MTTEEKIQEAIRTGDREAFLVASMRAGELSEARLRVAAYLGDEAAQSLVGRVLNPLVTPISVSYIPAEDSLLTDWTTFLFKRVAECAPVESGVACSNCEAPGVITASSTERAWGSPRFRTCEICQGTGRTTAEIPTAQHFAVTVAVAVARACLCEVREGCEGCYCAAVPDNPPCGHCDSGCACEENSAAEQAIEAAEAWRQEPSLATLENMYSGCRARMGLGMPADMDTNWLPCKCLLVEAPGVTTEETLKDLLASAATLAGEERAREIAVNAALKWALSTIRVQS